MHVNSQAEFPVVTASYQLGDGWIQHLASWDERLGPGKGAYESPIKKLHKRDKHKDFQILANVDREISPDDMGEAPFWLIETPETIRDVCQARYDASSEVRAARV